MSSLSLNNLPLEIISHLTQFVTLKDLKSLDATSKYLRSGIKDALQACFQNLSQLPFASINIDKTSDIKMRLIIKKLDEHPLSINYNLSTSTLNSIPDICTDIQKILDDSLVNFMESVTLNGLKLIDHKIFETLPKRDADSLRECFEKNKYEIEQLSGQLKISKVNLLILPPEIRFFGKIFSLSANKCELRVLPEELGEMKSLQNLSLKVNKLQSLPRSLKQHSLINLIDLFCNKFTKPPEVRVGTMCAFFGNVGLQDSDMTQWRLVPLKPRYYTTYRFEGNINAFQLFLLRLLE